MPVDPPIDRAFVLACFAASLRMHYLAVRCGCGGKRVVALEQLARDRRCARMTLAHIAIRLECKACTTGPDEVVLTETVHGLGPIAGAPGSIGWAIRLFQRPSGSSYHYRHGHGPRSGEIV